MFGFTEKKVFATINLHEISNFQTVAFVFLSGIGKIVGLTLALLSLSENQTRVSIVCTPSELENYESLSKKKPTLEFGIFSDASHTDENEETRKTPHVVVGAPSTIEKLINEKKINVENLQHIIFDECDQHFHDAGKIRVTDIFF